MGTTDARRPLADRTARMVVRSHPFCLEHVPPLGHPERPERLTTLLEALTNPADPRWLVERASSLLADDDILGSLAWLHDVDHIERVRRAAETPGWLDSHDCLTSRGTFRAALGAAGLALGSALDLVNGRIQRGFVACRPPSHHAGRARAHGYCFFNATAVAAEVIVRSWNRPVLIVDIDGLHGNGTQELFYGRADVGYLSVHRYPGFPGTGTADEIGDGAGRGATRNIPLAAGADDEVFCAAVERGLADMVERLQPAALVVSAGFTAALGDPIGGMRVTEDGYRRVTRALVAAAASSSAGRILSLLEGGFHGPSVARAARAHVEELAHPFDAGQAPAIGVN